MDEKQIRSSEEIDLFYFLRPINNGFRRLSQGLGNYFRTLRFNKFIFLGILTLGTLAGYSLRFIIPPAYEVHGIFVSNFIPAKYCSILIENLSRAKDIGLLSRQLKINHETAGTIESIKLVPMTDTFDFDRKDTALSLFAMHLVVTELNNIDTIQSGLIDYLENNEYARKRKEARVRSLLSLRESLRDKIRSFDSLKILVNNSIVPRGQGQGIILGEPVDPLSIYEAELSYNKEILEIEELLSVSENIEVLQPMLTRGNHNYPDYNKLLLIAFLASLVAALIITPMVGRKVRTVPAL